MSLIDYLREQVLGKIPRNLGPGEKIDIFLAGPLGTKGTVGRLKINKHKGNRHFSIQSMRQTVTKMMGDKLTDQYGEPLSSIRKNFDISRSAKT